MNFIVFIECLGRKLIVFCVSVCLPHTPIQIWRLHLGLTSTRWKETKPFRAAQAAALSSSYIWPKIFRQIIVMAAHPPMGSSTQAKLTWHQNKWEAMTAMTIDHNGPTFGIHSCAIKKRKTRTYYTVLQIKSDNS